MNNNVILSKAQAFRYLGLVIGIVFMIMSVRVYLNNYLTIQNSIAQTQQDITRTQSETNFIKNFQLPYLQTALAKQNFMHRQQMAEDGGKIVVFAYQSQLKLVDQDIKPQDTEPTTTLEHQGRSNFIKYQRQRSINQ